MAGKTGTAHSFGSGRGVHTDHAWFAGFAPAEAPKIAFAVVVENGGLGGEVAAPIAMAVADSLLAPPPVPPPAQGQDPAAAPVDDRPRPGGAHPSQRHPDRQAGDPVSSSTSQPRLPGRFGRFDSTLTGLTLIILIFGLLNLWSALQGRQPELASRQLFWLALGSSLAAVVAVVDYRRIARASYLLYAVGVGLLAYVDVAGKVAGGARSWLHIGPMALQPAEMMKPLLVLALARHIQNAPSVKERRLKHLLVPIALTGVPVALVAVQPDFGTAVIYSLIFVTIMITARFSLGTWAGLVGVAAGAAVPIWKFGLYDYQRGRILAFINPALDPDRAWQPQQAMHAVGSGRLFGKGYLEATQVRARSLPALWTDFPFAVFAEEWGFAGAVALIGCFALLILWLLKIARDARDRLGAIVCIGSAAMIFWQCVLNLGMVIGVLPVTGLTLPLISYGGSSLLTTLVTLGLCLNVSMRRFG